MGRLMRRESQHNVCFSPVSACSAGQIVDHFSLTWAENHQPWTSEGGEREGECEACTGEPLDLPLISLSAN